MVLPRPISSEKDKYFYAASIEGTQMQLQSTNYYKFQLASTFY
jgi:hypothetical protein